MNYKLTNANSIFRLSPESNISFPIDPENKEYKEYAIWVAAGNVPLPADPPTPPTDYSDSTNLEKTLQALMLCIAQVGGLTIPQAKALFKAKFNLIP